VSIDRLLAVVGVILGLPGFVLIFSSGNAAVGDIVVAAAFLFLIVAWYVGWRLRRPPFTMKTIVVRLEIFDSGGKQARLSKTYQIRPNFRHLHQMTHRNIAADGTITDLRWNDKPISDRQIQQVLGEYEVTVDFKTPLAVGRVFEGMLSYEAANSFLEPKEGLVYVADFRSSKVTLRIDLPQSRRCTSAELYQVRGASKILLAGKAVIGENGKSITAELKRPPVGAEYGIWWEW